MNLLVFVILFLTRKHGSGCKKFKKGLSFCQMLTGLKIAGYAKKKTERFQKQNLVEQFNFNDRVTWCGLRSLRNVVFVTGFVD